MDLAFDVYAKTLTGGALHRFKNDELLAGSFFRVEWQGTGSGQIVVPLDNSNVSYLQKDRYVRVYDLDLGAGELLGGFFLGAGTVNVLSKQEGGGRIFKIGGSGSLSYLDRAVWYNHSFENPVGVTPVLDYLGYAPWSDGRWHWLNDQYGDIIKRGIDEAQDILANYYNGRPDHPIGALTYNFTSTLDSAGNAWTSFGGHYFIPVGTNLLTSIVEFIRLGLFVDMDGDFGFHVYQNDPSINRSSATFAAGKVRFAAGVNIMAELSRAVQPRLDASLALVIGTGLNPRTEMVDVTGASNVDRETTLDYGTTDDGGALAQAGATYLAALKAQSDVATFPHPPASYPGVSSGAYSPGRPGGAGDYWAGDTVTIHTGTGQWDYNEQAIRVAAINWMLDPANGQWWPSPELGATYSAWTDRSVSGVGLPGAPCPCLSLCSDEGFIETDGTWKVLNIFGSSEPAAWKDAGFDDSAWVSGNASTGASGLQGVKDPADPHRPSDVDLARREYIIDAADLSGGAVVFKYAFDNAGTVWVNGVQVATLTGSGSGNYTSDHATTIARSNFHAGLNVVAIRIENESGGSLGNTPPGPCGGAVYIEMPVSGLAGTDSHVARCGHLHRHSDILGRSAPEQHPATAVTYDNATSGLTAADVQAAIDELTAGGSLGVNDILKLGHGLFVSAIHHNAAAASETVTLWVSLDGVTWTQFSSTPAYATSTRDPSLLHYDGKWWIAGTSSDGGSAQHFSVYSSPDLVTWSAKNAVDLSAISPTPAVVWAPHWFVDDDGSVHIFVSPKVSGHHAIYEVHPTNRAMTTWSTPVAVGGTGWATDSIDPCVVRVGSIYYMFYKSDGAGTICLASSSSLTSGYTTTQTGDWAGWVATAGGIEGPDIVQLDDGRWRIYFTHNSGYDGVNVYYSETADATFATGWSTAVAIGVWAGSYNHPLPMRIRGMTDHERDVSAHPALLATAEAAIPAFATPAIVLGTAAAAGAAATVIRSDSTIAAFDATVPVTQAFGDAAATGSAAKSARRDHVHGMPGTPATGVGEILISDTPSTPLIFADLIQTEAQDDLVYADP